MNKYLPSDSVNSLASLNLNPDKIEINLVPALLKQLDSRTISQIKNAFRSGLVFLDNGYPYVNVSILNRLLRTSESVSNQMWQDGIEGKASACKPYYFGNEIYITGADFIKLVYAQLISKQAKSKVYLLYIESLYKSFLFSTTVSDLQRMFIDDINETRKKLKLARIRKYNITRCEFTGYAINLRSEVEFAHIESVATNSLRATDIDNGVIIKKSIHQILTRRGIQNFAGMYDFCIENNYSTEWAEDYE